MSALSNHWTCAQGTEGPLVHTPKGTLRGKYQKSSRNGIQYEAFLGIKYGEAPKRFDVSKPTGGWYGVKDAREFGASCAQLISEGTSIIGEEDCLYLNVYKPKSCRRKHAVLVFIHGGGYVSGSSIEYGGGYLVGEGIVVVTINYRLGILGFLNTGEGHAYGNQGMKDFVHALKWVQQNIEFFGGDPNCVTVSGQSSGGPSALMLAISPLAKGLFHRIYAMSGDFLSFWAFTEDTTKTVQATAEALNCSTAAGNAGLADCFRKAPLEKLIPAQSSIEFWFLQDLSETPSLELKNYENPNPFLDKRPIDLVRAGNFAKVPIVLTTTKNEGFFIAAMISRNPSLLAVVSDRFEELAPIPLALSNCRKELAAKSLKFYFDNQKVSRANERNLSNYVGDVWFTHGIFRTARMMSRHTAVYTGVFNHRAKTFSFLNTFGVYDDIDDIVTHIDDLSYIYEPTGSVLPPFIPLINNVTDPNDVEFSKKMVKFVAGFVKTGVPHFPAQNAPKWNPVSRREARTGDIGWFQLQDEPNISNPFKERMAFWDNVYKSCQVSPY